MDSFTVQVLFPLQEMHRVEEVEIWKNQGVNREVNLEVDRVKDQWRVQEEVRKMETRKIESGNYRKLIEHFG